MSDKVWEDTDCNVQSMLLLNEDYYHSEPVSQQQQYVVM